LAPQTTCGPFGVSLSLGGRGVALHDIPCSGCGVYFLNMAWFNIKTIIRLIRLSLQVAL
jgi:hypothetical protein